MKRFVKSLKKRQSGGHSASGRSYSSAPPVMNNNNNNTPIHANASAPSSPQPQMRPSPPRPTNGGARVITSSSTTVRVPPRHPPSAPVVVAAPFSDRHIDDDISLTASNEHTRNLVKKFVAEIWNRGEVDLIPQVCSPALRFNGNAGFDKIGHDGLARMVATIRDALDDYHCEIHSMVVENNKAFCRLRFTGKHSGPLLGYEPTGKVVAWMGATEFTCQNGKILKVWELGDVKSLEEQLMPENDLFANHSVDDNEI